MKIKLNKSIILEAANNYKIQYDYDQAVNQRAQETGQTQKEQSDKVEGEKHQVATKSDVDNSSPDVEYLDTIYNNQELRDLMLKKVKRADLKIPDAGPEIPTGD